MEKSTLQQLEPGRESSSGSAQALEEFILFPQLPLELRRQIWRSAFPPPRTIQPTTITWNFSPTELVPPHPPITLSVNHESRVETLLHYQVFTNPIRQSGRGPQMIMVNPERDHLLITRTILKRLRRLANANPDCFSKFKTVIFRSFSLADFERWNSLYESIWPTEGPRILWQPILLLTDMEELHLEAAGSPLLSPEEFEGQLRQARRFYETANEWNPGVRIPRIIGAGLLDKSVFERDGVSQLGKNEALDKYYQYALSISGLAS